MKKPKLSAEVATDPETKQAAEDPDLDELVEKLGKKVKRDGRTRGEDDVESTEEGKEQILAEHVQWSTNNGVIYRPTSKTTEKLKPGMYEIQSNNSIGIFFMKIDASTEDLVRFEDSNSDKLLKEIEKFWRREDRFRAYNITYKRGIFIWGPPGTGKTCTIRLVMDTVINRGGIVIKFTDPRIFVPGFRIFREVQGDTPIVVVMEDIDELCNTFGESNITNILDGTDKIDKVIFMATTNFPEQLSARIVNRPSRFDHLFKIGNLQEKNRRIYIKHLIGKGDLKEDDIDVDKWTEDTQGFSISHIKELFISVVILGIEYDLALARLRAMRDKLEDQGKVGFSISHNPSDDE